MEITKLRDQLAEIEHRNKDVDWYGSLPNRKQRELDFHNKDRDTKQKESLPQDTYELFYGNRKYYSVVEPSLAYKEKWMQEKVPGKVFLDYACGNGGDAIRAARWGASLSIGLDISDVSVENARQAAAKENVADKCFFLQGDCENTGLPDNCIDVIICSGMLHHLDLSFAFPELRRVLKPGGIILALEALDYNPFIKLYRKLTPSMRTQWEQNHILSMKDIQFAKRFFEIGDIQFWHLFSILAVGLRNNKMLFQPTMNLLKQVDKLAMKIPGLQLLAWQFTFELIKPNDA